ncbi:uncharacterized protein LOC142235660 [Haematobia irritans]|uniref:uncharacterized protein LOC142235660 n=1 Tax=Haematobia irritans TaxID=7368 RepID=UPI003F50C9D3
MLLPEDKECSIYLFSVLSIRNYPLWLRAINLLEKEPAVSDKTSMKFGIKFQVAKAYRRVEEQIEEEFTLPSGTVHLSNTLSHLRRSAQNAFKKDGINSKNPYVLAFKLHLTDDQGGPS